MGQTIIAKGFCFAKGNLSTTVYAVVLVGFKFSGWQEALFLWIICYDTEDLNFVDANYLQKLKFTSLEICSISNVYIN